MVLVLLLESHLLGPSSRRVRFVVPPLIRPFLRPLFSVLLCLVQIRLTLLTSAAHGVLVVATRPP